MSAVFLAELPPRKRKKLGGSSNSRPETKSFKAKLIMSHWKIISGKETELYFLTATIVDWTHVFTSKKLFEVVIDSLRFCQEKKGLTIAGYVIMTNHLHTICAGSREHRLSDTMRDFKQFTAKRIIEEFRKSEQQKILELFRHAAALEGRGNEHKVWIEGNHPILVETELMFREKLEYIHDNPVRKGYVEKPEHWLYSSARNYMLADHSILRAECLH